MKLKAILCGCAAALSLAAMATPATQAQDTTITSAASSLNVGVNKGTLIRLERSMTDVFVANQKIADVQVRSDRLLYVYGVGAGETTIYATDSAGRIVYSANVRVAQNIDQIRTMLGLAMPGAAITVNSMNGMTLLTGTVANPEEVEEATRLVKTFVGDTQAIVNKLQTATPAQVNLRVKFAEVSRSLVKELGLNLQAVGRNAGGGINFFLGRGRDFVIEGAGGSTLTARPDATSIFGDARFLGMDVLGMIDALEQDGLVSLLAEPNLTALSGETASFLAGGEFPIAVSDGDGGIHVEFKQYGVGIAFTPTVLDGSRISLRVRPEVSELSEAGAIRLDNISIPALTTRRAETSIELGSGQSFMIAGLLRNRVGTTQDKTPLLGNLPIIGALFKSDRYARDESELVIIVTPYLVKPSNTRLALPTDGLAIPNDAERWLLGKTFKDAKAPVAEAKTAGAPVVAGTATPGFSND
ncbi:type II and III secretion system protein family protein [Sphingosinicella microcystinivorans]|uniref:type II and III secretion system protein family protein n=1 Tax=Sphingosinicella microcystinivorans TaxID=335406 RepID=UPI0022F3B31F|nr:type II and III secretion system protein family protein [Sphingosinicella microcystinivorans]WBX85901.1 type II and III secretion system protein family protein [Sphingosinicella microcystinivorans]